MSIWQMNPESKRFYHVKFLVPLFGRWISSGNYCRSQYWPSYYYQFDFPARHSIWLDWPLFVRSGNCRNKPVICVNKIDLIDSMLPFQDMLNFYENCGYQVILTSVANGKGLAEIKGSTERQRFCFFRTFRRWKIINIKCSAAFFAKKKRLKSANTRKKGCTQPQTVVW